ncbi:1-acyl-sn-glycerol-3-phosphate acyltransferase [Moorena sp. SIO3H5]|uniref:1-acyl-sn-glycerol-3-phosphate acyltransferase n=1 Tax=Moorena sp. SIO3H5 TaxID=2607834 RepID=UPI0013BDF438|nr:1-acyl-sn-glycerol-3-phosphate acyltransferase [Moorena sp. SIO3H5]NEO70680.1 1-acyl-sn-glycerol-3-phosphate acyltransferase [Moorena sp. SIO3H5]
MSVLSSPQFYPPRLNPLLTRLCQGFSDVIADNLYQLKLVVESKDLEKLARLEEERVLYLPNHPTLDDGIVLFLLSTRLGQLFHYVVAYESFRGWNKKFLPLIGAYSIRRGLGDRASIAQTLTLLKQPSCDLVIFPEGGCSYQNDTVMPFRTGAIQLPLQAMNQMVKQGEPVPNLYLVPVSLKYHYTDSMKPVIDQTLSRLEKALNINAIAPNFYGRLRGVAEQVILRLETEYDINLDQTTLDQTTQMDWNQRINKLKTHLLSECEQKLELTPATMTPSRERVYKIQSVLKSRAQELEQFDETTYESIYQATIRLLNFDAIYDGYVAASPTPERFLDTLTRLEREVFKFDRPLVKGHRKAMLRIGDPINIKDHFESYRKNRAGTVEMLTQQLQQTVQENLS